MTLRYPLVYNPTSDRVEELAVADHIPASIIEGLMGRNRIVNGEMRFAQEAVSLPQASRVAYMVDQFKNVALVSTVSNQWIDGGIVDVSAPSRWFQRNNVVSSNTASGAVNIQQPMEGVRTFSGKNVVFSVYVRSDANRFVTLELAQNFGTGGSPSAEVTGIGSTKVAVSPGWNRVWMTVAMPSVSGKSLGSDKNDSISAVVWFDAGANYAVRAANLGNQSGQFDVTCFQVEEGTSPTPYEWLPDSVQFANCQRFYETSYTLGVTSGTADRTGSYRCGILNGFFLSAGSVPFAVPKRGIPSISIWAARDGSIGNGSEVNPGGVFVANRTITPGQVGTAAFQIGGNNTMTAGSTIELHWAANARFP